ncbi:N-6 DNA methylase [Plantactinospora sp. WMMB334]|uniref:N-6 DNA methylase n=1 Tax=Plantactinospora sp. WMMB334 TaxID=3404119 RepID=UPI003B966C49
MPQPSQVTAAEISRLAGVTRATVSNWRRRHPDFPAPTGGTENSPAYDLAAVRAWLATRGQLPAASSADDLRTALRASASDVAHRSRLLPLVVAGSRVADTVRKAVELPDDRLPGWAARTARSHAAGIPGTGNLTYHATEVGLLRALLRCVAEEGPARTVDVLAEGDLNDIKASGQYLTPEPVADLIADLLAGPGEPYPEKVFDPACGGGSLLLAAAARGAAEVYGQDVVPAVAAQAAARLAIQAEATRPQVEARRQQVEVGDSMRHDAFPALVADAVLCAPPYGQRDWGHEELAYDPRWLFGLPPKGEPELAWLQHCLAHLTPGGRAVLLMPPGPALRPSGRRIRAEMVRGGALRAVLALPVGVAQPLHISLHLWLLERPHPQASLPSTVLMLDAAAPEPGRTADGAGGRPGSDWSTVRDAVLDAWHDFDRQPDTFEPIPGTARAVPVVDLLDEAVDLTPTRHVRAAPVPAKPDELAELAYELRGRLRRAASGLATLSGGQPWPAAGAEAVSWRTASVADLLRGEALTLLRAPVVVRGSSPAGPGPDGARVLTARDVTSRRPASGTADDETAGEDVEIRPGDVILPELLHGGAGAARVADSGDAGCLLGRALHLLRPDPARLDPWFLAGFLSAEDNLSAASSGTSVVRVDPRRLRIPLLPLAEQRRYGRAFRQLHAMRTAADLANRLADETARTLAAGLTGGALLPPDGISEGPR